MTPSKRKGVRIEQSADEPTDIAVPRAPWDSSSLSDEVPTVHDPDADGGDTEAPVEDEAPSVNKTSHFQIPDRAKRVVMTADPPPPAKAAAAPDDAYLESGTMLGDYRVEAQIGEGGMGVVYAAVHPLIGKRAAIKVLKAELCRSAFNVERFVDEARIVNQIGHPNIVDVFAFGQTTDGRSYFVMEWLKGESLRARIARDTLDFSEICDIVRPLARALEAAHEQGVIHRDLKPDNIFLVDVRGDVPLVKLLDFGIAKLAREEHRMERTATGAMVGTPQYIAPEQAKGYAIDERVDIYALGGILFELLTGRPPYVADNAMEMVAKHLMEPVPRPSAFADVPPGLDDIVMRMLSKTPDGRPTLAELAAVIERTTSLDRTNVKTPLPRARAATPVPLDPAAIAAAAAKAPIASAAPSAAAMSVPPVSVRAPTPVPEAALTPTPMSASSRAGIGTRAIVLLVLGFVVAAGIAYVVVAKISTKKPVAAEPAVAETKVEPAALTPKIEPKVEPVAAVEPKTEAEPKPEPKPESRATRPKPKETVKPPPPKKKSGRLELTVVGGKGSPTTITPHILIDGKASGAAKDLSPGAHTVMVSAPGMKTQSFSVVIDDGKAHAKRVVLEVDKPLTPTKDPKDQLMQPGSLDQ